MGAIERALKDNKLCLVNVKNSFIHPFLCLVKEDTLYNELYDGDRWMVWEEASLQWVVFKRTTHKLEIKEIIIMTEHEEIALKHLIGE